MLRKRLFTIVLFLALFAMLGSAAAGQGPASAQQPPDIVPGEILVQFKPGTPGEAVAEAHRKNGGVTQEIVPGIEVHVVRVPAGQEAARAAAYARNPNVLFAEVNGFYYAVGEPNDPLFGQQWQYGNIKAPAAWDVTQDAPGVAIAILDTGIDIDHPDLAGKVAKSKSFTNDRKLEDKYGHGTHVAGSAAAVTNNSRGVAGTCPNCKLYNVKVLNDRGSGQWDWVAKGITWAADNGGKVINMSLGGTYASSAVEVAVNYAWAKGVVIVAAAGNDGVTTKFYPAAYENAIAVAATDSQDEKPWWSNYGSSWVDVAAPGVAILSTAPNHRNTIWGTGVSYGTISGTSMAAPHVAGVAGLVWSRYPLDNASYVRSQIESTADVLAGTGDYWRWGRINACEAVGGNCN